MRQGPLDQDEPMLGGDPELLERDRSCGRVGAQVELGPFQRAVRLAQRLGERAPDRHHLAHRLHPAGQHGIRLRELLERPPWDLDGHVVKRRLEGSKCLTGDVVGDLVERVADRQHRGDLGDRETGRLRRESARAGHPGVHLDEDHAPVGGIDGELDVRPSGVHADRSDAGESGVAHGLVFAVGQGLRRRHGYGVARVHAHGVDVLDRTDHHGVVGCVPHDLELELLPSRHRFLDQHLGDGTGRQSFCGDPTETIRRCGDAAPSSPEHERGTHDHRIADGVCYRQRLFDGPGQAGPREREPGLVHGSNEQTAIFCPADGVEAGPDQPDPMPIEGPRFGQRHGHVQRRLPSEGRQERVGPLPFDHVEDGARGERHHVRGVREFRIGHDRGGVRVGEHHAIPLAPEDLAGLGPRVVELARLADDDGPRADHQDRLEVAAPRHQLISSLNRSNR